MTTLEEIEEIVKGLQTDNDPDWFSCDLRSHVTIPPEDIKPNARSGDGLPPIQQDDTLKPFLLDISNYGLNYAYQKYYKCGEDAPPECSNKYKYTKTERPRKILIIGAGMSGLVAGYELAQVGHDVKILEMQHRVGGRVKTISDEKFYKGLWADAGAMRLPGTGEPGWTGPSHFMTDFYTQKFELPLKQFINTGDKGYFSFYGETPIKMSEWNSNSMAYCDKFWPNWQSTLKQSEKNKPGFRNEIGIENISDYWNKTVAPVKGQLRGWLATFDKPELAWSRWITKWSQFAVNTFLMSTYEEVKLKLQQSQTYVPEEDDDVLESLKCLIPWPLDAIVGYSTFSYTLQLDVSLVDFLRSSLGQWGSDPMHTFQEGLRMIPEAFVEKNKWGWNYDVEISNNIMFGVTAREIKYTNGYVKVLCHNETTKAQVEFEADMLIITLPLNIIRQLVFDPPLPFYYYKAFENIFYTPSTKILLQSRTRFWQAEGINGAFSKTNMPIGQIHYPSNPNFEVPQDKRGILMCYTFKQEALLFGSQTPDAAIAEAVEEISEIHPQIKENFEVGAIQAWYDDPSSQGAFCYLKPQQYVARKILQEPYHNLYFCGEALSSTNGWIQGALESGLRAAYQLFERNEELFPAST